MNRSFFSSEFSKFFKLLWLLFRWFTWRHWVRSFRSGVAVFVSIRLATQAAVSGFSLFSDSLTGQSDWVLVPDSGSIPDSALSEIRETLGSLPISLFPVVETTAVESIAKGPSDRDKGVLFQLVGVDLMALQNLLYLEPEQKGGSFRNAGEEGFNFDSDEGESLVQMLNRADRVFISRKYSQKHNIVVGDSLAVLIHDEPVNLTVQGILPEYEFRATVPENLMLMDLPAVQALADQPGRIDRIEVRLPEGNERGEDLEWAESRLKALSRGRWAVVSPQTRRDTGKNMTMAFRFNLTALSFLALLVGIYLILQALEAAVVRRRSEIAVLRSMGVPQLMIQIAWLVESSALAMTGSLLGIIFGFLGARYSVEAVAGTVNALYYNTMHRARSRIVGRLDSCPGCGHDSTGSGAAERSANSRIENSGFSRIGCPDATAWNGLLFPSPYCPIFRWTAAPDCRIPVCLILVGWCGGLQWDVVLGVSKLQAFCSAEFSGDPLCYRSPSTCGCRFHGCSEHGSWNEYPDLQF